MIWPSTLRKPPGKPWGGCKRLTVASYDEETMTATSESDILLLDYRIKLGHSLFVVDWVGGYHGH